MIAAVATSSKLLFNTFDVVLVVVLAFGFWRGRKNGMTKEVIPMFRWLSLVIAAGYGYPLLGNLLLKAGVIKSIFGKTFQENTAAYLISYLFIAAVVYGLSAYVKKAMKKKLEGSSMFGNSEYYLGMVSGMIRYACMVIFGLALLSAPYYTQAEIDAKIAYNNRWYGGGLKDYKGNFIPSMDEAQIAVFKDSLFGPFIRSAINIILINSGPTAITVKPAVVEIQN
jgi:uncharacterized membrane protein required for colicin V production